MVIFVIPAAAINGPNNGHPRAQARCTRDAPDNEAREMALVSLITTPQDQGNATPGYALPCGANCDTALRQALAAQPQGSPIIIMVHGKGYKPGQPALDPHELIFAPGTRSQRAKRHTRFVSWPKRLKGICIGFGWTSTGSIWHAARTAQEAGKALAALIAQIHQLAPGRRVDLIGHSLGARVCLSAVEHSQTSSIGRVLLLAGAEFSDRAQTAARSPAGQQAEFFNITSRENDLFDFLFECALSPMGYSTALGRGVEGLPNWLDIQLDNPQTCTALRALGLRLGRSRSPICHWSVYLRPGAFALYRRMFHDRQELTFAQLRASLATQPDPRWSRLSPIPLRPKRTTVAQTPLHLN